MAAGGSDTGASIRHAGRTAHERGPAGPVVAFCRGDRCVGSRVGMAPARGLVLMGGALWERLARVVGRGDRERSEAERILLEADFGVEATEEILDRVWREGWRSRLSGGARARRDRGAHAGGPERRAGRARPGAGAADSNPGL